MVEDLKLINEIRLLKERKTVICGNYDLVRKSCKLCIRAGFSIYTIYSDDTFNDEEIKNVEVKRFNDIWLDKELFKYNIIIAEKDNDIIDTMIHKFKCVGETHIYTYCGLYNAIFSNLENMSVDSTDLKCMEDINYSVGIHDFLSRWLRSIRWVNESAISVLLYAMPKTGTQAMKKSLIQANIEHTYIHFLNLDTSLSNQFGKYFGNRVNSIGEIVENYSEVKKSYLNIIKRNKIKIITVMRDPVARNFSMAFQAIKNWGIGKLAEGRTNFSLSEAVIEYIRDCQSSTFDWFEDEINQIFGIDIYQYLFNKEKGYQVIQQDNVEIFIYKLEKSTEIEEAIRVFLNIDNFELIRKHESSKESYRFIYDELKQTIHIPKEILDTIYGDERMKHFYSKDEIDELYKKWI